MTVNFGIIGCGRIAERHAEHILNHDEAALTQVFDIDAAKGAAFGDKFGVSVAGDLEELLSNDSIDIVNICSPNGIHYDGAMAVLNHNKHVLVEKPMALKKEHCEEMISKSLKVDKKLFVVKQNRFNPPVVALHDLIDNGKLGDIFQVVVNCYWNRNEDYYKNSDWKGTKELDGGTLYTQFSHFIDIFYYLFGDIDVESGVIGNFHLPDLIEFEDSGNFVFRFKNGGLGSLNYTTSSFGQNMEGSITVFAENATIKIGGQYLNVLEYQKTGGFDIGELPTSGKSNDYGHYQGSMSNHDKMIHNVIEALNGRESIMANAFEGMKVVEIIENFYKAAKWVQ